MLRHVLSLVPPKEQYWSGESCSTGFVLQKYPSPTNPQETQITVGIFRENTKELNGMLFFYLISAFVLSYLLYFYQNEFFQFKIFTPIFILIGLEFGISTLITKENKQWHACEHKSAVLLEHKKEITTQNLKLTPKTNILCGSSLITLWLQLAVSFITLGLSSNNFLILLWCISSACFLFYVYTPYFKMLLRCILLIPSLPAIAISLCVEKFLFLKEPSEEQYQQTERELKAQLS